MWLQNSSNIDIYLYPKNVPFCPLLSFPYPKSKRGQNKKGTKGDKRGQNKKGTKGDKRGQKSKKNSIGQNSSNIDIYLYPKNVPFCPLLSFPYPKSKRGQNKKGTKGDKRGQKGTLTPP